MVDVDGKTGGEGEVPVLHSWGREGPLVGLRIDRIYYFTRGF